MNLQSIKASITNNVDTKTVFSVVAGMAVFGLVTYFAVKTGIAPLKTAAAAVNGGK